MFRDICRHLTHMTFLGALRHGPGAVGSAGSANEADTGKEI